MKTMKKIVAILAVALMLCSILPLSAFAAGTEIVFELGANGSASHNDGSEIKADYTETVDDYTLTLTGYTKAYSGARDAMGNSCIKLGTGSLVGGFSFTVPDDVTSVVIAAAQYKANKSILSINGTEHTLSSASNSGAYDEITVDTTSNKTVQLTTTTSGKRAMINSITYVVDAAAANCDHDSLVCGDTCPECGEYTKEHVYSNNCVAECENGCGTANPNYADHVWGGDYDANCDVCGEAREINFPEADSVLTIEEAVALGQGMSHDSTTPGKYYVTGVLESIAHTTYGNLYIQDDAGNKLYIYGTYSADGSTRYDAMAEKPVVGMTITVYGVIGNYNGAQMKNGWITEMTSDCEHEWDNDCDTDCNLGCGYVRAIEHNYVADIIESTCTQSGSATYECSVCGDSYDEELPLAAHNYVNDVCDVCGAAKPAGYAPITSADQLISGQYVMVVGTGYAPTYLDSSTSNPWVLTGQPVITDGVISADDAAAYLWTLTVDGNSVIITDANGVSIAPKGGNNNGIKEGEYAWSWSFEDGAFIFAGVDTDTVYLASNSTANSGDNKFRAYKTSTVTGTSAASYSYKFTLYAASSSAPKCEHEYFDACDPICLLCGEEREVSHNIVHVAAVEPTCSALGNIEFWYCDACGAAWANEACTLVTNMMSVKLPMAEHTYDDEYDADCNVCGDIREVPEKPVEILYGDVNGDGQVTITDEALVSQYLSGWEVTLDEVAADVNDDGQITITDEALISQYLSGWDVVLGPEKLFNDGVLGEW